MKGLRTSSFSRWLLLLLALNLAARLPLCWDPANVSPDGAEYLAIARSLRTAGQYAADLKWQFFTDEPVQHLAWADRPPLYPAFAAICATALPFVHPATAGRLGNVLLAGLALMLGVLYLRRVFNERVALVAAGYVFLLPHTLFWTTQPLTESLSLTLSLAALLAWAGASPSGNHSVARALVVGLLAGLAYLTRPTGVLLLLVFLLDVARQHRGPRATPGADARNAGSPFVAASWLLAGFLLFAVPYHVLLWKLYGSPFHSALGYTFSVASVHDVTVNGFEREHPGTLQFLRQHATEVPGWVLRQALAHAQGLLLPLLGLLPFALRMRATDWTGPRWAAGALVVTTLLVHTAAWSAKGSSRYFLLLLLVLAAALLWAGERARAGEVITRAGNTWRGRRWTMLSVALPLASCV
ncbi:MAG TPA: glycosyltransferase family 39 protein, partial [Armatimonadota bacterium]|nr:glycosyltransferase family 39 protein [Armatimonadota bacterium]